MEERLYSTAEIMLATGMERGTVTNRAKKLGFERNGFGYTAEQVMQIMLQPLESHRRNEEAAMELRNILNQKIKEMDLPMGIIENEDGQWKIAYHVAEKGRKIIPKGQEAYRKARIERSKNHAETADDSHHDDSCRTDPAVV